MGPWLRRSAVRGDRPVARASRSEVKGQTVRTSAHSGGHGSCARRQHRCLPDALGTVTPVSTVTVASRVAGEVMEVRFKEGQLVKKNDLLAGDRSPPLSAVLLQGQGQLARDAAALKNARIDLVRYQNSFKEHAIPEQQLATQQATVDQDEGTGDAGQGQSRRRPGHVDYTRIVSPIDGRVGLRNIDAGNIVTANGTPGCASSRSCSRSPSSSRSQKIPSATWPRN